MDLELIKLAEQLKKKEESKPVQPTLVIGLGGTGKEILLRFRRRLVERLGSLDELTFLQFLHLDTDTTSAAREQYDLKAEDDPLYDKVRFSPSERVDLTIPGGTAKYIEHVDNYPQIKRWYQTDGKTAKLGDLGSGAGQIRSASRLGFFHASNFAKVAGRLESAQSVLRDAANAEKAAELGFDLDPNSISIFVATSLAGGTGSGVFLDMGFLLQKYFPSADRIALLLLPKFFSDYAGGDRVRANGYAALTELNHFSFGNLFIGDWGGRSSMDLLAPPPFSTTYLLDSTNEAGLVIGSAGKELDAYQMCAEFLYQDFSISKFAAFKRAVRVNLVSFNMNVYTHNYLDRALSQGASNDRHQVAGDTFPTRFGSFGLATISFPTERVHNACGARLARDILESWQRSLLKDPRAHLFGLVLDHPKIQFVQGRYERQDGAGIVEGCHVEDALLWFDRGSSRTFQNEIWDRVQAIRGEIEGVPKGEKAAMLERHLRDIDQNLSSEDSETSKEWGVWVRTVEENMRYYLVGLESGIEARAEELANDPDYGLVYALSLLQELKVVLHSENYKYLPYFEAQVKEWDAVIRQFHHDVRRLSADLAAHDRQFLFRKADLERDLRLLAPRFGESNSQGALYNYVLSRVMKQVMKRGLRICRRIDEFLGKDDATGRGLIGQYYQLLEGFEALKVRLGQKERYFSRPGNSELSISLYRQGDVDRWYDEWLGGPDQEEEKVTRIGNRVLAEVFGASSVAEALDFLDRTPPEESEGLLLSFCKRYFENQDDQPEALRILLDSNRYSVQEREEMIGRAYRLAKVWAREPEGGLKHISLEPVRPDQRPCLIGLDLNDQRRSKEFQRLVNAKIRASGDSVPAFKSIGEANRGAIVFYNELGGVPAFYPSAVMEPGGLKESYEAFMEKDELFTDKNRFQFGDLIPKEMREAREYAEALKAFVLGRLLGVLRVKEVSRSGSDEPLLLYSYKRRSPGGLNVEEITLGEEDRAIDRLYRDARETTETDRRKIIDEAEARIDTLKDARRLEVYVLLLDFYMKHVYPPVEQRMKASRSEPEGGRSGPQSGAGDVTYLRYPPNFAILDRQRQQAPELVATGQEFEQLKVSLENLRGKPMDDELTYEEYVRALGPYTKRAGVFARTQAGVVGVERTERRKALALDISKFEPAGSGRGTADSVEREPASGGAESATRACPNCSEQIDVRAIFCRHCKSHVSEHVTCPHCGENRVPSDLERCWRCGKDLGLGGEKIECPQCFEYAGPEESFPCPVCGYAIGGAAAGASTSTGPGGERITASATDESAFEEEGESGREESVRVQCPTCYEEVEPGPTCTVCGGSL